MYALLFYSKIKAHKKFNLGAFEEAIHILENKYRQNVIATQVEFFSGWNRAAFEHFLEGHKINQIIYSNDLKLKSKRKQWFDIVLFIQKTRLKNTSIPIAKEVWSFDQVELSFLFNPK